ncbi:MAG: septum formation initiator family protein [Lachnospiraceae bacterium]|nr:septum formation initiator family protein [Lachnospiraceae bacterium]MBR5177951.1 septum formation initiator family protein [Lachnospiraceae bacterium]
MAAIKLKKRSRVGLAVILIAVMLICGFVFWRTRELEKDKAELDNQLAQIQDQIDYENRQNQAITNEIKYRQTDDYIEDQARDTFGLRDEDETIFKPGKPDE